MQSGAVLPRHLCEKDCGNLSSMLALYLVGKTLRLRSLRYFCDRVIDLGTVMHTLLESYTLLADEKAIAMYTILAQKRTQRQDRERGSSEPW